MIRHRWTASEIEHLKANYARRDTRSLAIEMGLSFDQVRSQAKNLGLKKGRRHRWTAQQLATLRERYPNEPTERVARDLGLSVRQVYQKAHALTLLKTEAHLASPASGRLQKGSRIGRQTQFRPGYVPHNKGKHYNPGGRSIETRFQRGRRPQTWVPVGTEVVDVNGYRKRKISDTYVRGQSRRGWAFVHRLLWQEHHGEIPASHVVTFRNGDPADLRIENLELTSRAELARRNGVARFPPEIRSLIATQAHLTRCIREAECHEEQD